VVGSPDTVLMPGFPLAAPDHLRLTRLLLDRPLPAARAGLYVEQPYATWRLIGRGRRTGAQGLTPAQGLRNLFAITFRTRTGRRLQAPTDPTGALERVGALDWLSLPMSPRDWWLKQRAIRAYKSQVDGFGPLVISRVVAYEVGWGGEAVAWLRSS
jgi:hypothetical protein